MAYVQKSQAVNICIRKNGNEMLLDGGTVTLPVIGGNTTDRINACAYTSTVNALRIYNNNSTPPVNDILGASSVVSGSFLFNVISQAGDYIDIYNKTHGIDSCLRISFYRVSGGIYEYSFNIIYQGTTYNINGGGVPSYGGSPERGLKLGVALDDTYPRGCIYVFRGYAGGTPFYQLDGLWQNGATAVIACRAAVSDIFGEAAPEPPTPSTDPYADGGTSTGTTTGTGTFDDTSESVPLPSTYSISATASGLMSQYVLTEANLAAFGSWLWNGGTIVDDLKHFFQSPMEAIFSVGILPFTPSDTTPYNVYVGALAATGVQGGLVGDTVEKISCGSIDFDGYYGGALDYNPYTKIELFLPYCGTLSLNADEVMGHTISVDYYCDTITGDCVAFVSDEDRVLHQVRGNCFIQIPLAARDFTALYSSAIAAIGTIAAGLATAASGGLSAPVAVGMGSSMAANAMNAKTHIARAGGVSGMAGFMSVQTPYVIMTIPNQCLPEFQNDFQGYPLFVTKRLGDFSGFTKVYEIHLDGLDCTDAEAKEIYELLKGGVIL